MRQGQAFRYSIIAGWLVTALAAFLVGTILIPEGSRSAYFWHRLAWTELLVFLIWGSTGLYFLASDRAKDHVTRFGGIAPTISIVIALYAAASFVAMILHAFVPETNTGDRIHLIVQIILFAAAALCVVFLSMARAGAAAGLAFDTAKVKTPRQLHDLLALREASVSDDSESAKAMRSSMKRLREALLYSLNESESLANSPDYQALSTEIQALCASVAEQKSKTENSRDRCADMLGIVDDLVARAKFLSANQTRR